MMKYEIKKMEMNASRIFLIQYLLQPSTVYIEKQALFKPLQKSH